VDPVNSLISHISEDIYKELKQSLELGHWPSGVDLTESQKSLSIQALISYENIHLNEVERTAYIHRPEHEACDNANSHLADEQPVKFKP